MVSDILVPRPAWRVRLKYVLAAFITAMFLYVLVHNESFFVNSKDAEWQHIAGFRWWLLPHGLAGACALFLGALQFSDRIRARFIAWHRWAGRVYVTAAFVLAPLGTYIQYFEERMGASRSFTIAAAVDALLLMTTTGIAFYFIRHRQIEQHRRWMTRSFAVALIFLEVRLIGGVTGWDQLGDAVNATIVWCCVGFSLLIADIVLQCQDMLRTRARKYA